MDLRIVRRLAYDGNYQRAIEMLLDLIEKQEDRIQELEDKIDTLQYEIQTGLKIEDK